MHKQWKILIALLTLGGALFVAKQFHARRAG